MSTLSLILDGKPLSTRTYEDVKRVDEDIAAVKIADKWGYVTVDGKTLVDPKYDDIAPFHEGYGLAARDGQISIFDKSGTIVGKASGEKVMLPFYNGYAGIKNDGKCSYIKPNGEILATVNATKLMPFLHLPVQSGSDRILKAMNRKHTAEQYLRLIERIRAARPDILLSSDFIVGFPGETDRDFEDTMDLIRTVGFGQAFSFKYSARPGTPASQGSRESILRSPVNRLRLPMVLANVKTPS